MRLPRLCLLALPLALAACNANGARAAVLVEEEADGLDLPRLQRALCPNLSPEFQARRSAAIGSYSDVSMMVLLWPRWQREKWGPGTTARQLTTQVGH